MLGEDDKKWLYSGQNMDNQNVLHIKQTLKNDIHKLSSLFLSVSLMHCNSLSIRAAGGQKKR